MNYSLCVCVPACIIAHFNQNTLCICQIVMNLSTQYLSKTTSFCLWDQAVTRNEGLKLEKCRFGREIGRNWFSNCVVCERRTLNNSVVSAQTLKSFKRRLDKFLEKEDRWKLVKVFT